MFSWFKNKQDIKIFECKDAKEIANLVSQKVIELVKNKPNSILILPTGSSPVETYKAIINDHKKNKTSYSQVKTFNLDEYVDLKPEFISQSYSNFMNVNLFDHIDINRNNIHFPNQELVKGKYDKLMKQTGKIDLALLGVGVNGHIGFNEPNTSICSKTHLTDLDESTRQANSRFFKNDINNVPSQAITMGLKTILQASEIIVIATGNSKKEAIRQLLQTGKFNKQWPITALKKVKNVSIYIDKEANPKN